MMLPVASKTIGISPKPLAALRAAILEDFFSARRVKAVCFSEID